MGRVQLLIAGLGAVALILYAIFLGQGPDTIARPGPLAVPLDAPTDGEPLFDPEGLASAQGCLGWSEASEAVACAWQCDTRHFPPAAGLMVHGKDGVTHLDLGRELMLSDPEAWRATRLQAARQLEALDLVPEDLPAVVLTRDGSTDLGGGWSVAWTIGDDARHTFEVQSPKATSKVIAGGAGWLGCGEPASHSAPTEADAVLVEPLGLVVVIGSTVGRCCDDDAPTDEIRMGMAFVSPR